MFAFFFSDRIISDLIKFKLSTEFINFLKNLYHDCGLQEDIARAPIKVFLSKQGNQKKILFIPI